MGVIIHIVLAFSLLLVIMPFFNLKLAVAFYIAYMILVPFLQIKIMGIPLSYNLINIIFLSVFIFQYSRQKIALDFTAIKPFLFLYITLLILSFFEWETPWTHQLNTWRMSFMKTCIIPFILWNISLRDISILKYIKWAIIISITIACLYGIYLMQLGGANPYTSYLTNYFGIETDAAEVYQKFTAARLNFSSAAKIQSTLEHPMTWCLILCFIALILFSYTTKTTKKKGYYWLLLILVGFNILISGVRTGVVALVITFLYYVIQKRNWKLITIACITVIIAFFTIQSNESLSNLFSSFTDVKGTKSNIEGSSIAMRIEQLQGAFNEIEHQWLVGKGYSWTGYYMSTHMEHPILLGFESLFFIVLCNNGVIGIVIWIIFFILLFRTQRKVLASRDDIVLMDCMVVLYFSYAMVTGEYGYISFFAIYYTFLMSSLMSLQPIADE